MKNVLEWLELQASINPDAEAFSDVDETVSFAAMENLAKHAGSNLSKCITIGQPVVFFVEKSVRCLAGMFGAVYAGGFYSVIDVKQPEHRVASILEKLSASVMVTDQEHVELAMQYGIRVLLLEELFTGDIDKDRLCDIRACHLETQPLYVNFTSGSTGTPKGVTICHRSVIEFISIFTETFGIKGEDVIANQAPFDFDVSVKDIYSGLAKGAKVQLIPRKYFSNPSLLMDYLADHEVTVLIWAVSAMCFVSVMNGLEYRLPEKIRLIMFSGEVMPIKHLNKWKKYLPDATYVNLYGPTEITCNCTYHVLNREYALDEVIPIGKAFANEKVFLLDENDCLITEEGIEGEICVSGTSVGLGYYADPEKTALAFVQNPLHQNYIDIIYRTGDLGKYIEDEVLVYTSRKDFQIKHMGHRIELGEIEAIATSIDGVTRSCCLYDSDKQKLFLYYTGDCEKNDLAGKLRVALPPYMVPNKIILLEEMPMNKNGKIDRNALKELK